MKKSEEDLKSLASGELWESFKKTLYFQELEEFMSLKITELRDLIVSNSESGKYDEARDLAQQLKGFRLLTDFIDDTISTRIESLQYQREQKEFERQLPHRL